MSEHLKRCRTCGETHPIEVLCTRGGMSAAEAAVTPPDFHVQSSLTTGGRVTLPKADPWDTQTGHDIGVKLSVAAEHRPLNDSWSLLTVFLKGHPMGTVRLSRNPRQDSGNATILKAISTVKRLVGAHGAKIGDVKITNPQLLDPESPQDIYMDVWVFGRLGVALDLVNDLVQVHSVD